MPDDAHTFLFMDLVGFTALTAEQGDDSAAEVALRLYAHVRELLPAHSGEEIKTIGDAMMIRGDDPQLAMCLGLRVVDELDARGLPPVRVGVHTGSAVQRHGDWYGAGVNVASRLCSAAGGGEVLVSDAAREASGTPRHISFGARQLHWLKNVPQPVAAFSAERQECSTPRRPLHELARMVRRAPAGVSVRYSEVTG